MALMIKYQILVNKHLPVRAQRNKLWQKILDLFKFINKDTTAMPLTQL